MHRISLHLITGAYENIKQAEKQEEGHILPSQSIGMLQNTIRLLGRFLGGKNNLIHDVNFTFHKPRDRECSLDAVTRITYRVGHQLLCCVLPQCTAFRRKSIILY
ncbi:unnamed protein product [Mucor fragilis]